MIARPSALATAAAVAYLAARPDAAEHLATLLAYVERDEGRRERDATRKRSRPAAESPRKIQADSAENPRNGQDRVWGEGGKSDEDLSVRSQDQGGSLSLVGGDLPPHPSGSRAKTAPENPRRFQTRMDDGDDALSVREARMAEARSLLIRSYAEHWGRRENANDAWMSAGANSPQITQVATYLVLQGDMAAAAEEIMAGFFRDEWARENRWPWKRLAKDPARYRQSVKGQQNERAVAEYERAAKARDEAYRAGDHAEGQRLERVAKETYERAFGRAAG